MSIDGIFIVNKDAGITSYGVVARVRRLSAEKKAGHAGTLDPDATGVLPVCLGKATRISSYLMQRPKTYRADVEMGSVTDTGDASGNIVSRGDPSGITMAGIEAALGSFRGRIQQIPPMYSAIKHEGQPLYRLARAGIEIPRQPRPVTIYRLQILACESPVVTLEIECGRGTYIRTLAEDLGLALGCGAHLKNLTRTACGGFSLSAAVTLTQLAAAFEHGYWHEYLVATDGGLLHLPAVIVSKAGAELFGTGQDVPAADASTEASGLEGLCRVYSTSGRFLGLAEHDHAGEFWRPKKVLARTQNHK